MPDEIILFVEDDPILQTTARLAFKLLGYECRVVGTGEEAVELARENVSIIFMDVGLPGINGMRATHLIREQELKEQRRRVPIIALSGHADEDPCMQAGMDDFLPKPALMPDLKRMIEKWRV